MGLWNAEPPQGETSEQGLLIISRSPIPRFGAPQGIGGIVIPPTVNGWINDEGKQFLDDNLNPVVFEL